MEMSRRRGPISWQSGKVSAPIATILALLASPAGLPGIYAYLSGMTKRPNE